jgi:hypothetical protein
MKLLNKVNAESLKFEMGDPNPELKKSAYDEAECKDVIPEENSSFMRQKPTTSKSMVLDFEKDFNALKEG